ncbi:hypothetical protein EXN61_06950 [Agrobacterium tumefaciens]|uniref:Propionyl-coenzyme A carboxylase alpha polypeptide n=1 Tax=Agrobacterium tumefaciens TaxID=358 RepID=A0A546Y3V2_AGRTU|nr:hypothetical protein EXN61_06950 [Agrobacterium tumefaciens]
MFRSRGPAGAWGLHPPSALPGISPSRGGDRSAARSRLSQRLRVKRCQCLLPISPLEGEMPGRAEGGKPHAPAGPL